MSELWSVGVRVFSGYRETFQRGLKVLVLGFISRVHARVHIWGCEVKREAVDHVRCPVDIVWAVLGL